MEHKNTIITIALSAIASSLCTAAALTLGADAKVNENSEFSAIASQVEQLRSQLTLETQARESLELQVFNGQALNANNRGQQQLSSNGDSKTAQSVQANDNSEELQQERAQQFREQRRAEQLARQQPGYRAQQLVAAGFAREEAERIVQIESEESLRQLQAQYDSRRARATSENNQPAITNPIRSELGDQNYERYLEANGRPTSARVGSIIGGSAAENAGLIAGDDVISYAGERVFNLSDVNNLTIQGNVGESVLIEVERGEESIQLTIPRGPIGISGGRRGRRR